MSDPTRRVILESLFEKFHDFDALAWESFREGVEIVRLYGSSTDGPSAALLRYAPGAIMPRHRHLGYEHVLILQGAQTDEQGVYKTGTLAVNPPGSVHGIYSEGGCIALLIWEKPVIFDSPPSAAG